MIKRRMVVVISAARVAPLRRWWMRDVRWKAIALSIVFENTPRVVGPKCTLVEHIGEGLWHVVARFGFFKSRT